LNIKLLDTSQMISDLSDEVQAGDGQGNLSSAFLNIWTPDLR
jgi:hypothetical protein